MEIASLAAAYSNRKVLSLPVQFISVHESLQLAARLFLEESKTPAAVAEK
jgi:hypothetical protein